MDHLYCSQCEATYDLRDPRWRCDCGSYLDLRTQLSLDPAVFAVGPRSIWRYRRSIPIADDASIVTLSEGFTPLADLALGGRKVKVKLDHLCPTGSFKARGASVLVSRLREIGASRVVEDSSGNAGSALAAYCAAAGLECTVFVPENANPEKTDLIKSYGAEVVVVEGARDDAAAAAIEAAESAYYASHAWSPFFLQGTKTLAYEICEQLAWRSPDTVVLPVGNGTLLLGAWIGFTELLKAGLIGRIPKLVAVQAEACDPLARAFRSGETKARSVSPGETLMVEPGHTIADGIAVASPVRAPQIIEAVRQSGGTFVTVSEAEIKSALHEVLKLGYLIEPTAAVALAAIVLSGAADEQIVTVLTGHAKKQEAGRGNF